jgi:ADP-ribose pyrophosphatase
MSWQVKSSRDVYTSKYMRIFEDQVVTEYGDELTYAVVHKDPFVIAIPVRDEKLLLVGQYRYTVDRFSWEFPMGHAEKLASQVAVAKELREETGYSAKTFQEIGRFYPANGHLDQLGIVYVATGLSAGEPELEPSERGMQSRWVTRAELAALIQDGTIMDGPTITAFYYYKLQSSP